MKDLQKLQDEINEWADKTFGKDRKASAPIYHLKREISELLEALENGNEGLIREEFADCFILILNAAGVVGLTVKDLHHDSLMKMDLNRIRKWGTPDKNGVVEHLKKSNDGEKE